MVATASTIFKIRATSDFLAQKHPGDEVLLSFRRGQAFYVLSTDKQKGLYFVSTQYATPFSRTAVSGLVPVGHFEIVDLLSKDPSPPKPVPSGQNAHDAPSQQHPERSDMRKSAFSHLTSVSRRYSDGARLQPPRFAESDGRRAETLPRNVGVAQDGARFGPLVPLPNQHQPVRRGLEAPRRTDSRIVHAELFGTTRISTSSVGNVPASPHHVLYQIQVTRANNVLNVITRSFDDFIILHNSLSQAYGHYVEFRQHLPALPTPITVADLRYADQLEHRLQQQQEMLTQYVAQLMQLPSSMTDNPMITRFFASRTEDEATPIEFGYVRRKDSGYSAEGDGKRPPSKQVHAQGFTPAMDAPKRTSSMAFNIHAISSQFRNTLHVGKAGAPQLATPDHGDFDAEEFLSSYAV
ncbi:hypothetical protein HDU85_006288 [Gaertneriomyces sp. JEL0708]|nr:hypothetical protein HDU85_006288 [Gaertneriomyces sp. JEL0708]